MHKIKISLDTNSVNKNPHIFLDRIREWGHEGFLEMEIADALFGDINEGTQNTIEDLPVCHQTPARERTNAVEGLNVNRGGLVLDSPTMGSLNQNHLDGEPREDEIKTILFGDSYVQETHYLDVRHLGVHDASGNDFFITNDNHFLNKTKELAKIYIYVISPEDFVIIFEKFFDD